MANFDPRAMARGATSAAAPIDEGLRSYMLRVYNYMTTGLALTGVVAWLVASTPAVFNAIFGNALFTWVIILAPLGLVFFLSFRIHKMSFAAAQTTFWIYAALNGLALSTLFLAFTGESIAKVFFITAAAFAGLSLYGYTTRRDLSGMGSFLFMGLIGLIIAIVVNMFLASTMMSFVISVIGVLIFAGLTAYDTQAIKNMYYEADGAEIAGKKSVIGALKLYLDFLNMFVFLLHLFGMARE